MVMPRNFNIEFKKDGATVFTTHATRGCIMERNELAGIVKGAISELNAKGDADAKAWTSVSVNNQEFPRTKAERMAKQANRRFGGPGFGF